MAQERTAAIPAAPPTTGSTPARGSTELSTRPPNMSGVGGTTKIADSVVSRIAGLAAREIPGVHDMSSTGIAQSFSGMTGRMTGQDHMDKGVAVQVGEVECIVDLTIVVDYEASIPQLAEAIRRNVSGRIQGMTGLETKEINIYVSDLYFAGQEQAQTPVVR